MSGALGWFGNFAGIASQAYNAKLDADLARDRLNATRDVQLAQASAQFDQSQENRSLLNNVLLGVGALLGLMVVKKALT